nr:MAG TPA: hypothetical protein [Caudoviricetes sp.]
MLYQLLVIFCPFFAPFFILNNLFALHPEHMFL